MLLGVGWVALEEIDNDPGAMIALSIDVLEAIDLSPVARTDQRVCHHFSPYLGRPLAQEDSDAEGLVTALAALDSGFDIETVGGVFGVECWEQVRPTTGWVRARIPEMCDVARTSGLHYDGWSWEPPGHDPVVASSNLCVRRAG